MRNLALALAFSLLLAGCAEKSSETAGDSNGNQKDPAATAGTNPNDATPAKSKAPENPRVRAKRKELAGKNLFPFEFSLPTVDGKMVSTNDYAGKALIVDIWGTWCPPCREEVPHFVELQQKYGSEGLQIVGINCSPDGSGEAPDRIKRAISEFKINYPCVVGSEDVIRQVPDLSGFPTTLFIGRDGTVREMLVGAAPMSTLELLARALVSEPAPEKQAAHCVPADTLLTQILLPAVVGQADPAKTDKADAKDDKSDKPKKEEKDPEPTYEDLMQSAAVSYRSGKYEEAADFAAKASKAKPEEVIPYRAQLVILGRWGGTAEKQESTEIFLRAARVLKELETQSAAAGVPVPESLVSGVRYNEAVALARQEKMDDSRAALQLAFKAGYKDFAALEAEEDLAPLFKQDDFKKFVADAKAEMQKRLDKEVAELFAETESFSFAFSLPEYGGEEEVSLADFNGKVVIVDIWGTWCPPCRKEIPHFVDLAKKYKKNLQIVGLNYERNDDEEKAAAGVLKFKKQFNMEYPCLVGDDATKDQVPAFRGYPTTLFVDQTGTVRLKVVGYKDLAFLETAVKMLLDEKAPGPLEKKPAAEDKPAEVKEVKKTPKAVKKEE